MPIFSVYVESAVVAVFWNEISKGKERLLE